MSATATTLYTHREAVIDACRAGFAHVETFHTPAIGPESFDTIRYPYAQVLPENSGYQGGNEFEHLVRMNGYFERSRDRKSEHPGESYLRQLETMMDAVSAALDELDASDVVVSFVPETIEDFAGEVDGSLLIMISVRLRVGTLVDLADG